MRKVISFCVISFLVFSCGNKSNSETAEEIKADSLQKAKADTILSVKKISEFVANPGPVGVYDVPEMLTLCVRDSAKMENMPETFSKAYATLDEELENLKIKSNGSPGSIYFSSDPKNVVFECVYPIEKMPEIQPKKSVVVVLEACYMYMYNYYGPYAQLSKAYEDIKINLKNNNLVQNGPMREFYITNPNSEKDSTKWLTRILTPVEKNRKH